MSKEKRPLYCTQGAPLTRNGVSTMRHEIDDNMRCKLCGLFAFEAVSIDCEPDRYNGGPTATELRESARKQAFNACPILADYLATALQDLQYTEMDEACEQERDERDSGTIYDCPDSVFEWARAYCERFLRERESEIHDAYGLVPGYTGFAYAKRDVDFTRIGSTLYLESVGHGVGFTDDGNAPCLEAMSEWARDNRQESLYFGDDGRVYAA